MWVLITVTLVFSIRRQANYYCYRRCARFVSSWFHINLRTVKRPFHIGWFCSGCRFSNIFATDRGWFSCILMHCSWKRQLLFRENSFRMGSWITLRVGLSNRFTVLTSLAVQAKAPRLLMRKPSAKHSIFRHDFAQHREGMSSAKLPWLRITSLGNWSNFSLTPVGPGYPQLGCYQCHQPIVLGSLWWCLWSTAIKLGHFNFWNNNIFIKQISYAHIDISHKRGYWLENSNGVFTTTIS